MQNEPNDHKMDGKSLDIVESNKAVLKELFPEVFSEGKIDFEKLRSILGDDVETSNERYNFTWNGKRDAISISQSPSMGTLRPCKEESINWDSTNNLYIKGDNLEVLKLLQRSYRNKIKLIYIDPPYNTGSDFVYEDDFSDNIKNYKRATSQTDSDHNPLSTNLESSGRFHTRWLNMIYPRLKLARNLLSDDGSIFISIDDNEITNLLKICDEVFGEQNHVGTIIWERAFAPKNDAKYVSNSHDYIVIYAKNLDNFKIGMLERTEEANSRYKNPDNDPRGPWASDNLTVKTYSKDYDYEITTPSGSVVKPTGGRCWFTNKRRMQELIDDNRIWFGEDGNNTPRLKRFLSEVQDGMVPTSIWYNRDVGHNQEGRQELKRLFDGKGYFDGPKPIRLLKRILKVGNVSDGDTILDFFGGSSSTAHACMEYSKENGMCLKSVTVQIQEPLPDGSDAYESGYHDITDIGIDRIRRAGKEISNGAQATLDDANYRIDVGIKVFELDSSNILVWNPESDLRSSLLRFENNLKIDGRTDLDVVYEILLKKGLDLNSSVDLIDGSKFYSIASGALMVCLEDVHDTSVAERMVELYKELQPLVWSVVFKDNGFSSDDVKANTRETLRMAGLQDGMFETL